MNLRLQITTTFPIDSLAKRIEIKRNIGYKALGKANLGDILRRFSVDARHLDESLVVRHFLQDTAIAKYHLHAVPNKTNVKLVPVVTNEAMRLTRRDINKQTKQ